MKNEKFKYDYPTKEISLLYENDEKTEKELNKNEKIIIEIPKKRPEWFSNELTTKVITNKNK